METNPSLLKAISEEIFLLPHDPRWAELFLSEQHRLFGLAKDKCIAIEHVGSTAVPGLLAKPIIDILAGVESLAVADALIPLLCENGYETSAEYNATLSDSRWLMRHNSGKRTHHLHLAIYDGPLWRRWVNFRDELRLQPATAARYEALKLDLAKQFPHDREAYTQAKAAFMDQCYKAHRGVRPATPPWF